jgi:eukaryotic-like serine/threonine-protein kinase
MNQQQTSEAHLEEDILAHFVADLERATDVAKLVADYALRHPHMSGQLDEYARIIGNLEGLCLQPLEPIPSRFGEFRVVRAIPGGGMGRIYEAIQEPLGRRVAVKTIRSERLSPQLRERFLREQTVLASLHQTHIVPIHTAGQSGDVHYFAMPYIEGVTLHQIVEAVRRQHDRSPILRTPTLARLASHCLKLTVLPTAGTTATQPTSVDGRPRLSGPDKVRVSRDYFRSVAMAMLEAAEAVHYVHGLQILHRDLKPSNLMVDVAGECWIIDFGLAAYVHDSTDFTGHRDAPNLPDVSEQLHRRLTLEGGHALGTPQYMAPEQWKQEKIDARTDVWGLGVTLYELLALRQAFPGASHDEVRRKIESSEPAPPRGVVKGVPHDLEAVCRKALRKDPADRYQTAQDFASDLGRWLNHEPVAARRTRVPRRVWLWARRNRGWAAALVVLVLACTTLAAAQIQAARNRATFAESQQRAERRESLIQQAQNVRLRPHQADFSFDWLDDGWNHVREAAQIRKDDALRDQAAAFLAGVNGHLAKEIHGFEASSVACDADGWCFLIGGSEEDEARIWDSRTDELHKSGRPGNGPVTFCPDGTAVQLVATRNDRFPILLWNVDKHQPVREFKLSGANEREEQARVSNLVLTHDGRFAAASAMTKAPTVLLTVWDISHGTIVRQVRVTGRQITTIAVSDDGGLLAAGDAQGGVAVWPLPEGKEVSLPAARQTRLKCLAFGANVHGRFNPDPFSKWLLAGGDSGGTVTIWDLGRRAPLSYCRGSNYDIDALAFSPDGVTLASGGHTGARLWDIVTGRELLDVGVGNFATGLAFSRDAKKLAASKAPGPNYDQHRRAFSLWDLEYHRGVQTLRGLASQVAISKVCFNRDATRVAAVSLDWRVGIWDLPSGNLCYLLDVSPGSTADNTGLAFSPDGRKFAVSAGSQAQLCDLETGESTRWQLPEGLVDTLVFDAGGKRLLLFRMETEDGIPSHDSSSATKPLSRVGRMRDLLASPERDFRQLRAPRPMWETRFFKARIFQTGASSDGRYVVAGGEPEVPGHDVAIKGFDWETGKEVFSLAAKGNFILDPMGQLMGFGPRQAGPGTATVVEIPSGKFVDFVIPCDALAPGARFLSVHTPTAFGNALYRRGDQQPLVTLGIDSLCFGGTFSVDGSRLAWGNQDGTVTVCYLEEIQRRLAAIGLGW